MAKSKIFVTRRVAQEALDMIAEAAEIELWEGELPPSHDILLKKVPDIDGLLSLLTDKIDADDLHTPISDFDFTSPVERKLYSEEPEVSEEPETSEAPEASDDSEDTDEEVETTGDN